MKVGVQGRRLEPRTGQRGPQSQPGRAGCAGGAWHRALFWEAVFMKQAQFLGLAGFGSLSKKSSRIPAQNPSAENEAASTGQSAGAAGHGWASRGTSPRSGAKVGAGGTLVPSGYRAGQRIAPGPSGTAIGFPLSRESLHSTVFSAEIDFYFLLDQPYSDSVTSIPKQGSNPCGEGARAPPLFGLGFAHQKHRVGRWAWLTPSEEHAALHLRVGSSSPTLGAEIT